MNDFINHHPKNKKRKHWRDSSKLTWRKTLYIYLYLSRLSSPSHLFISLMLEFTIPINSSSRNLLIDQECIDPL